LRYSHTMQEGIICHEILILVEYSLENIADTKDTQERLYYM